MLNCGDIVKLDESSPNYYLLRHAGKEWVINGIDPIDGNGIFVDSSKVQYLGETTMRGTNIQFNENDVIKIGSTDFNNLIDNELIIDDNLLNIFEYPKNLVERYQFDRLKNILIKSEVYNDIQNYKSIVFTNIDPITYGNNYLTTGMKIIGKIKNERQVEKDNESNSVENKNLFDFIQVLKNIAVTRKDILDKVSFVPYSISDILSRDGKLTEIEDNKDFTNKTPTAILKKSVTIKEAINRLYVYESLGSPKEISEMKRKLKLLEDVFNEK